MRGGSRAMGLPRPPHFRLKTQANVRLRCLSNLERGSMMAPLTWFCRCGKLNVYAATRCAGCGLARSVGEKKDPDLSRIVKPPPKH